MSNYLSGVLSSKETPQTEPIPGSTQTPNSAGGFSWQVNDWIRLQRFCLLGSEGGSYYSGERELTLENAKAVRQCIIDDGLRAVREIATISEAGRAAKVGPCLFALAMSMSVGNAETKNAAFRAFPRVVRTGSHLLEFASYIQAFRGWGRGLRRAIAAWYTEKKPRDLAYQCVKYQQRNGWSHRDLLRLSHPKALGHHQEILHWAVKGWPDVGEQPHPMDSLLPVWAFERAKRATDKKEIVRLIRDYDLVRECVPTQFLTEPEVWNALLEKMPLTAMVRNLATMTRIGLLAPMSQATGKVLKELADAERIKKARLHPIAVLAALKTYAAGHGERGKHTWQPVAQIVDALDSAFYFSFGAVEPTGRRWLLALDVSGSMASGAVAGVPGLSPRVASAAMALVTANVESQHAFVAFSNRMVPLGGISPRQRLDDVVRAISNLPFAGTDCALPMLYALEQKIPVDVFVTLTDSESWAGKIHASQALEMYRQKMGIPAKAICVGMVANRFSVLDENDAGSLNVVGFDTATPNVMSDFARG